MCTPMLVDISVYSGHEEFRDKTPLASVLVERWYMAPGVQRIEINDKGIRGTLFIPPGTPYTPSLKNKKQTCSHFIRPLCNFRIHCIKIYCQGRFNPFFFVDSEDCGQLRRSSLCENAASRKFLVSLNFSPIKILLAQVSDIFIRTKRPKMVLKEGQLEADS